MRQKKDPNKIEEAIGYLRVSTEGQANNGRGLEKQLQLVRQWAQENGWRVPIIYEDVASAAHPQNLESRPEFQQAVNEALRAGVPLIVADATRLSRDLEILDRVVIKPGLTVISVEDDGEIPVGILRQRVASGAEHAKRISQGTKAALREVSRTRKLGSRSDLRKAAQASARVRIGKKNLVLDQVVDLLVAHPDLRAATSQEIADRLNEAGILTSRSVPWTASAVRGKWKEIRPQLELRDEMAAEDAVADTSRSASGVPEEERGGSPPATRAPVLASGPHEAGNEAAAASQGHSENESDDDEEMRKHPLFARF
ncbi:recombinase family protein [Paracoccus sp. MC1854]|uniref:recombinase family protein n=1 Tax=Paracoccus sp. MC1854 TaxID=2760306 RepID=UPI001600E25F|nr:recombinase family protein [Paracoccus sp. MC1854]MBB1493264.1 recombinase family protein [Paracoccus sp. MC1854]